VITIVFAAILLLAIMIALMNWRHGWFAAVACGVLQDPFRKLTPGTPAIMTMSVVAVYGLILLAASATLYRNRRDFALRFPNIYSAGTLVLVFLLLAAMRGVATFGIAMWKVPLLSFIIYTLPIPAVLLGYSWLTREEQLVNFFKFYSVLTSIAMIGTPLEYLGVRSKVLGMVAMATPRAPFQLRRVSSTSSAKSGPSGSSRVCSSTRTRPARSRRFWIFRAVFLNR